jgi:hypothetical protein
VIVQFLVGKPHVLLFRKRASYFFQNMPQIADQHGFWAFHPPNFEQLQAGLAHFY